MSSCPRNCKGNCGKCGSRTLSVPLWCPTCGKESVKLRYEPLPECCGKAMVEVRL